MLNSSQATIGLGREQIDWLFVRVMSNFKKRRLVAARKIRFESGIVDNSAFCLGHVELSPFTSGCRNSSSMLVCLMLESHASSCNYPLQRYPWPRVYKLPFLYWFNFTLYPPSDRMANNWGDLARGQTWCTGIWGLNHCRFYGSRGTRKKSL